MEHFRNPFGPEDFVNARVMENRRFVDAVIRRARSHRLFSHPFLSALGGAAPSRDVSWFILTSFYKIVEPFTGLLCALAGRAPDLRSRFALMDNVYEEMGRGDFDQAHARLYVKLLASIGVGVEETERTPALRCIQKINDHLVEVLERRPFSVGCAVLAAAESTIPPTFPVLAAIARCAFPGTDLTFFERHGLRDAGHAGDASMLFAVSGDRRHFATVETAVKLDLDHRSELLDEWMTAIAATPQRGPC